MTEEQGHGRRRGCEGGGLGEVRLGPRATVRSWGPILSDGSPVFKLRGDGIDHFLPLEVTSEYRDYI